MVIIIIIIMLRWPCNCVGQNKGGSQLEDQEGDNIKTVLRELNCLKITSRDKLWALDRSKAKSKEQKHGTTENKTRIRWRQQMKDTYMLWDETYDDNEYKHLQTHEETIVMHELQVRLNM